MITINCHIYYLLNSLNIYTCYSSRSRKQVFPISPQAFIFRFRFTRAVDDIYIISYNNLLQCIVNLTFLKLKVYNEAEGHDKFHFSHNINTLVYEPTTTKEQVQRLFKR